MSQTYVEELAIALQRSKTFMEVKGLQDHHWTAYMHLSDAIYAFERSAKVNAPALRDAADGT